MTTAVEPNEELLVERVTVRPPVSRAQRLGAGISLGVIGLVTIWRFGIAGHHHQDASIRLGALNATHVPHFTVPAAPIAWVCGVLTLLLGLLWLAVPRRRWFGPIMGVGLGLFVVALICWLASASAFSTFDVVGTLTSTIQLAVPLILGALCGVMCERSAVINVAIEGQMLAGAWASALVGSLVGITAGMFAGVFAGALIGAILAVFAIRYMVNQVVLGVVLNVFAAGLTGFLYDVFMQTHTETLNSTPIFEAHKVPLLGDIPVLGSLLFDTYSIVYLTYVLIIAVDVWLFRTRWGLRTRAVGEHPKAADTVGINVLAMRYRNVIIGGAIAGLGGSYFIFQVGQFQKNITSGQGFIALAALIFGRWSPRGAVAAALLFGFASAMQLTLSINAPSIPSNVVAMLPYLATIVAVAGLVGKVRAPAADGEPYVKG
ncbi:ABC transporter permease [Nocardioides cynanchi]|uniref:ABC transporter permease n=1 Tax=Nocardioides cynanchi TaxID=2558918 RepID=UPI0012462ABE|nr:ABC transporter permease [Nocardioides cynanchi]